MTPRPRVSVALGFLFLVSAAALAQKDDVIVLLNGDHYTGEIKSYSQGRVTLDTSAAGWISIKWNKILSIKSTKQYDVETIDGLHHYGSLSPSEPTGKLVVVSGPETLTIGFFEVFDLTPVFQSFWRRWEGSLDLGFNYTQSSNLVQFNVSADATYRRREFQIQSTLSSFFSRQEGVTATERGGFATRYDRFLGNRWVAEIGIGVDRNIQLGLDLRLSAGFGFGRYLLQANQKELVVFIGLLGNHEQPVEGASKYNSEAVAGGRYSYFMYDFPKLTISASLEIYPSLSTGGRVRLEASASAKREIVSDFYLSLSVYDSFDGKDPTTGLAKNDWGPTLSIGWQF
ncbi:MAG TPA: DUF481 domain-containing protein [Thermoanaerobaculia bacterium]